MFFNSLNFFIFFTIVLMGYYSISSTKLRIYFLLVASYYFYMQWEWSYGLLLAGITLLNYFSARSIAGCQSDFGRRLHLWFAIGASLAVLFYFKYVNFANQTAAAVMALAEVEYRFVWVDMVLPVGISFYIFQALSYTIDVYRKQHEYEPDFSRFALYVSFFPQLVAGPIERAGGLLDQFQEHQRFEIERFTSGAKLVLWGLFKKVVVAEQLATYVDKVYGAPELYSGSTLLLATYFFAFQIYLDFSAYSDMAIGLARMMGFDLRRNFNLPYLATSITDFWRRWHISLTKWFTDYIYIPLGGSRVSRPRWVINIFIIFLISGLWHGAAVTFVIWGLLHAVFYVVEVLWKDLMMMLGGRNRIHPLVRQVFGIVLTFHAVSLGWIFFRADSLSDAMVVLSGIANELGGALFLGYSQLQTYLAILFAVIFIIFETVHRAGQIYPRYGFRAMPLPMRWAVYIFLIFSLSLFGISETAFIYFQF